jgi:hypothetical protein
MSEHENVIISRRRTKRITALFAVLVVEADGREGVVRFNTPTGSFPWITDDPQLAAQMLALAREDTPYVDAYLARFTRTD